MAVNQNRKKLLHIRSKILTPQGTPKLPQPSDIEYGEIAINFLKDHETFSIKNSNDEIVALKFGCCESLLKEIEKLKKKITDLESKPAPTDNNKYVTRGEWLENNTKIKLYFNDNSTLEIAQGAQPIKYVTITVGDNVNISPNSSVPQGTEVTITPKEIPSGQVFDKFVDSVAGDIKTTPYKFQANEDRNITMVTKPAPPTGSIYSGYKVTTIENDFPTEDNLHLDQAGLTSKPEFIENTQNSKSESQLGYWIYGISKSLLPTISSVKIGEKNGQMWSLTPDSYTVTSSRDGQFWIIRDNTLEYTSPNMVISLA